MKKSILALFLALLLCAPLFLVSCDEEDLDQAARKAAVVNYLAGASVEGGTQIPSLPETDAVKDTLFDVFSSLAFCGELGYLFGDEIADETTLSDFVIKDGLFVTTDQKTGAVKYTAFDKNFNIVSFGKDEHDIWQYETSNLLETILGVDLPASLPSLLPPADGDTTTGGFDLSAIPAFNASSLVVKDNRVSVSKKYLASLYVAAFQMSPEGSDMTASDIKEATATITALLDAIVLDIYFEVTDTYQIAGFGLDFDIGNLGALIGTEYLVANFSVVLDPSTGALKEIHSEVCMDEAIDFEYDLTLTYTAGDLVAGDMYLYLCLYESIFTETGSYVNETNLEIDLDFYLGGIQEETSTLLTLTAISSYTDRQEDPLAEPVETLNFTATISKEAADVIFALAGIVDRVPTTYRFVIDTAATPTLPTHDAFVTDTLEKIDVFFSGYEKNSEIKEALLEMTTKNISDRSYDYYDAETYTRYTLYKADGAWKVSFRFEPTNIEGSSVVRNQDGSFEPTEGFPVGN